MKNIFNIITIVGIISFTLFSCESTELDKTTNPNNLSPEQSDVNSLLNNIQLEFIGIVENGLGRVGGELARIDYMNGTDYTNAFSPAGFNNEWTSAYADMLADIRIMTPNAESDELFYHVGIAQTLEAFTIVTLVDFFGDIPYSEALQGIENPNPNVDPGSEVYDQALILLDSAIENFNKNAAAGPTFDFFYDGDTSKWIKAANTIKMKIYLQTRLVDNTAISKFNDIVDSGNFISSSADDFQFNAWGTNEVQPDTRHPRYTDNYTTSGGGDYMSNWLIDYMLGNNDPRIRYYFYRQVSETPNNDNPNEETLQCSLQSAPTHFQGTPFEDIWCSLPNGYWGRIHGSDEGIPPDGFLRTLTGVYPAAGTFDDDRFEAQVEGDGGGGAGITPIILASTVDFYRAEVAMLNSAYGDAKNLILDGLQKSVAKVTSFGSLDTTADLSFEPTATDITDHADAIEAKFDAADSDGKWNILAEEYFTNLFGNGLDGYNFYRRTGFPTTVAPNVEPNPGGFIRSFFYPANFVNNNSNVQQKPDVDIQVFWDNNPPSPGFPIQN